MTGRPRRRGQWGAQEGERRLPAHRGELSSKPDIQLTLGWRIFLLMSTTHRGSCHCGAVRYEVELDLGGRATQCNCTICTKTGVTGASTKPPSFRLLTPEGELSTYAMSPVATRYFCPKCGVHCFGRGDLPELGGAFVSINVNTLDDVDGGQLEIGYWDGRHDNWHAGLRDRPWPIGA